MPNDSLQMSAQIRLEFFFPSISESICRDTAGETQETGLSVPKKKKRQLCHHCLSKCSNTDTEKLTLEVRNLKNVTKQKHPFYDIFKSRNEGNKILEDDPLVQLQS